jgi:hypothetical protein
MYVRLPVTQITGQGESLLGRPYFGGRVTTFLLTIVLVEYSTKMT